MKLSVEDEKECLRDIGFLVEKIESLTEIGAPEELSETMVIDLDPHRFYKMNMKSIENIYGEKPGLLGTLAMVKGCLKDKTTYMIADPVENIIYTCNDNIKHHLGEDVEEMIPYMLTHEIAHIYLNKLFPKLNELRKLGIKEVNSQLSLLDETFADYCMDSFEKNHPSEKGRRFIDNAMNCHTGIGYASNPFIKRENGMGLLRRVITRVDDVVKMWVE